MSRLCQKILAQLAIQQIRPHRFGSPYKSKVKQTILMCEFNGDLTYISWQQTKQCTPCPKYEMVGHIVLQKWLTKIFMFVFRFVHWPPLYKRIHKKHHEWQASIGIIALYAHPLEHIMSNLVPIGLGPLLCGSHVSTMWLWFAVSLTVTIISHSGFHFPLLPSSEFHDFHHFKWVPYIYYWEVQIYADWGLTLADWHHTFWLLHITLPQQLTIQNYSKDHIKGTMLSW